MPVNMTKLEQHQAKLIAEREEQEEKFKSYRKNLKLKKGDKVLLRLCPPPEGGELHFYESWMHSKISGLDNYAYCTEPTKGSCVICDEIAKLLKSENDDDIRYAKSIKARPRYTYNVIQCDTKETMEIGIQNFTISREAHEALNELELTNGDSTDPDDGYRIWVKREGELLKTKYHFNAERDNDPIPEGSEFRKIFCNPPSWEEIIFFYDDDEMERMLDGELVRRGGSNNADETEETTKEEKPRGRSSGRTAGKKRRRPTSTTENTERASSKPTKWE